MTEILQIDPENPDPSKIREAVEILRKGGLCAYPTETFYGLGADVTNEAAIKRLFDVKRRDYGNPVAVIVSGREMLASIVAGGSEGVPEKAKVLMDVFWPGPLTILFRTNEKISRRLTTNTGKIGIRVSSHPVASALTRELGRPLTTTSANLSGFPPSLNVRHLKSYFGGKVDAIIDSGELMSSGGSTVVDVTEDKLAIIREGVIKAEVLYRHFEEEDYEST
jgi:L-threonylcarbamoyladenylate synthase